MLQPLLPTSARTRLAALLARPGPVAVSLEGRAGEDVLAPLLSVLDRRRRLVFSAPGLTDLESQDLFRRCVLEGLGTEPPPTSSWSEALGYVFQGGPMILVLHRPNLLAQANRQFWAELGKAWVAVRKAGTRSALLLAQEEHGLASSLGGAESPFALPAEELGPAPHNGPLERVTVPLRSPWDMAAAGSPWTGPDLLTAWSLLGTNPERWRSASTRRDPRSAVRDLILGRAGPYEPPDALLGRLVQTPHRYASMLRALARGAHSRRELSKAVDRASTSRSASGPYLRRLMELGLVSPLRPLDAGPRSRKSRYRLTDPHEALWWAWIHALGARIRTDAHPEPLWARAVGPRIQGHQVATLSSAVEAFLRNSASDRFGAPPREVGPLWGDGYDFPVAATLRNGAVCYAHIHAGTSAAGLEELARLEDQMREVRYGFGRQARLRLLVSLTGFRDGLRREAARSPLIQLIGAAELAGS
ncbi:MAG: hypothetical protein HKN73_02675 [Gemmatimonadetes bacterium]|nr:hypothetical protein [Gemmatimonadota bacterium]